MQQLQVYPIYKESFISLFTCFCVLGSWDSHIINSTLSTEIIVHGPCKEVVDNSSSVDTVIDSDVEIKPVIIYYI